MQEVTGSSPVSPTITCFLRSLARATVGIPGGLAIHTDAVSDVSVLVESAIRDAWGIELTAFTSYDGGMNSRTWLASAGERRWVAKAVPADAHDRFVSGLAVATIVEAGGIRAGAPEPTRDGPGWVRIAGGTVALLSFVEGDPLVGHDPQQQRIIGSTLARVHALLIGARVPSTRFHWLNPAAAHLDVEPWIRSAVARAIGAYDDLAPPTLTWGYLHSDPAPEAFLLDSRTGTCGVIDWDTGLFGPLMYDVASAVMYVSGPRHAAALLDAYSASYVLSRDEISRSLAAMLRLRWAIQADYFARRIAVNDLTGIADPAANQVGLDDARHALT
jgi:Ser/Thr protein kinase RdoA (MazF antagonist)